jgi:hypothetical protein
MREGGRAVGSDSDYVALTTGLTCAPKIAV